jgi:addiction module HigA family antidote
MTRVINSPKTYIMFNPPHPGETIKEVILQALNLTVAEAALQLDVDPIILLNIVNGEASISVDIALKLENWIENGPSAEVWLGMQMSHDLWKIRHLND